MANYAMNELEIIVPHPDDLQEIIRKMKSACNEEDGEVLSFQSTFPMPEILEGTVSPPMSLDKVLQIIEKHTGEKMSIEDFEDKFASHPVRDDIEEYRHNQLAFKETGYFDWYDWQYQNWGVKWGACDTVLHEVDSVTCLYTFSTPWGSPKGWLDHLSKNYPEFKFHHKCSDPAMNFHTEHIYKNGELIHTLDMTFQDAVYQGHWGGIEEWEEFFND